MSWGGDVDEREGLMFSLANVWHKPQDPRCLRWRLVGRGCRPSHSSPTRYATNDPCNVAKVGHTHAGVWWHRGGGDVPSGDGGPDGRGGQMVSWGGDVSGGGAAIRAAVQAGARAGQLPAPGRLVGRGYVAVLVQVYVRFAMWETKLSAMWDDFPREPHST